MARVLDQEAATGLDRRPSGAAIVLDGRYMPPPEDSDGKQWVRTSALIAATPERAYAFWRDIEAAPAWWEQVFGVRKIDERRSRWSMQSGDRILEWEVEILADEPGRRIAWRSTGGDLDEAGEVMFEAAPAGRGTIVTVLQEFRLSKLESVRQTLKGRNPKQSVIESLRHFKALIETGEIPRTQGQPHGPRGLAAKAKSSAYAENVPTPPGIT